MHYRRFPEIGKYLGQRVANCHGLIDCQLPLAEMRHHGLTGQRDAGFLTPVKVLDQNDDVWRRLKFHLFMRAFLSYILKERSKWNLI